jgi:ribose 1,5-bisphosphokinase
MGPSGAGKDSVLDYARATLAPSDRVVFAHRYITRPAGAGGENHIALTHAEFEARKIAGLFAFDWQAHETFYGIGTEVHSWQRAGMTVVINGSRKHYSGLKSAASIVPVIITAPIDILMQRLAGRGRENEAQILARLQREAIAPTGAATVVIDNSGLLEVAGRRFLDLVRSLARSLVDA